MGLTGLRAPAGGTLLELQGTYLRLRQVQAEPLAPPPAYPIQQMMAANGFRWFVDVAPVEQRLVDAAGPALGLPLEERFMYSARGLDRILEALRERDLIDVIAFAEIFNEVDGMEFRGGYEARNSSREYLNGIRLLHEEALDFLITRHPDIPFAVGACPTRS